MTGTTRGGCEHIGECVLDGTCLCRGVFSQDGCLRRTAVLLDGCTDTILAKVAGTVTVLEAARCAL